MRFYRLSRGWPHRGVVRVADCRRSLVRHDTRRLGHAVGSLLAGASLLMTGLDSTCELNCETLPFSSVEGTQ